MSQRTTRNGLNVLQNLEIGTDELQWWQAEMLDRAAGMRRAQMAIPGWFGARSAGPNGAPRYGWVVREPTNDGNLVLSNIITGSAIALGPAGGNQPTPTRYAGILPNGRPVQLEYGSDMFLLDEDRAVVNVPADDVWYTLIAREVAEVFEPGQILLTKGSTTVTGIRTDFTRYGNEADDPVATVILVTEDDSANGNEGEYTVVAVTDEGTMTIDAAPVGDTELVNYRVKGRFFVAPPDGDPVEAHRVHRLVWELITKTTIPPADALFAYDCYRTGTDPTILIDRRHANEYRRMPEPGESVSTRLVPAFLNVVDTPIFDSQSVEADVGSDAVTQIDMAPCAVSRVMGSGSDANGMLLVVATSAGISAKKGNAHWSDNPGITTRWPGALSAEITQANIVSISLEQQQGGLDGWTHGIAYSITSGVVKFARSLDNGANFVVSGTVWDPTAVDAADRVTGVALLYTRFGRLILAGVYFDDSANTRTIRYVYSDDYGDTWVTNSHAGFVAASGTPLTTTKFIDLVQDGWGNIVGVFNVDTGATEELWVWTGTSPIDPTVDNNKASVADKGTKLYDNAAGPAGQPRAVAFDDGTVYVAFATGETTNGANVLHLVAFKENELLSVSQVGTVDTTDYAGPTGGCPIGLEASNTGDVLLVYYDTDATAAGDLFDVRYTAVKCNASPTWPGGRSG